MTAHNNASGLGAATGVWGRLGRQFALVSLRPRLAPQIRVRQIGAEFELYDLESRRVLPIDPADAVLARRFDGEQTVAEIMRTGCDAGQLAVGSVLALIDRLIRAEMLDAFPPQLYAGLASYFGTPAAPDVPQPEPPAPVAAPRVVTGPWRARSPQIAERARFLRSVSLLRGLDLQTIGALADGARAETWPPASTIISEGGRADRLFIVRSGEVTVRRRDDKGRAQGLARLGPGEWFGETALLDGSPRNASVCAGEEREARLLSFDDEQFDRLIRPHVTARAGEELVSTRRLQLEQVPIFRSLASADLDRLAGVLSEHVAERGSVLFRQGETADCFYVIEQGAVGVVKDGAPIAKLVAGEFFGETALLFTQDRTATIAATEDTRFWVLDRATFDTFLRDALLQRRDLMPTVLNRLGSSDPV
ncbi:MAG: cyclic nucleotide-binding domain-containing protein [Gaiellales bacterium]